MTINIAGLAPSALRNLQDIGPEIPVSSPSHHKQNQQSLDVRLLEKTVTDGRVNLAEIPLKTPSTQQASVKATPVTKLHNPDSVETLQVLTITELINKQRLSGLIQHQAALENYAKSNQNRQFYRYDELIKSGNKGIATSATQFGTSGLSLAAAGFSTVRGILHSNKATQTEKELGHLKAADEKLHPELLEKMYKDKITEFSKQDISAPDAEPAPGKISQGTQTDRDVVVPLPEEPNPVSLPEPEVLVNNPKKILGQRTLGTANTPGSQVNKEKGGIIMPVRKEAIWSSKHTQVEVDKPIAVGAPALLKELAENKKFQARAIENKQKDRSGVEAGVYGRRKTEPVKLMTNQELVERHNDVMSAMKSSGQMPSADVKLANSTGLVQQNDVQPSLMASPSTTAVKNVRVGDEVKPAEPEIDYDTDDRYAIPTTASPSTTAVKNVRVGNEVKPAEPEIDYDTDDTFTTPKAVNTQPKTLDTQSDNNIPASDLDALDSLEQASLAIRNNDHILRSWQSDIRYIDNDNLERAEIAKLHGANDALCALNRNANIKIPQDRADNIHWAINKSEKIARDFSVLRVRHQEEMARVRADPGANQEKLREIELELSYMKADFFDVHNQSLKIINYEGGGWSRAMMDLKNSDLHTERKKAQNWDMASTILVNVGASTAAGLTSGVAGGTFDWSLADSAVGGIGAEGAQKNAETSMQVLGQDLMKLREEQINKMISDSEKLQELDKKMRSRLVTNL